MTTSERPIALITGASRGIGKAILLDLARSQIVCAGVSSESSLERLRTHSDELPPGAEVVEVWLI